VVSTRRDYAMLIYWSDEDQLYLGVAPDLRGCMTHGHTPAEALANLEEAIEGWLASAEKHGDPIPVPTARPMVVPAAG
jgi:predicted RNase H-like HicB family nuclease